MLIRFLKISLCIFFIRANAVKRSSGKKPKKSRWFRRSNWRNEATDTKCGNIADRFDIGPGIKYMCTNEKCKVSCPMSTNYPSVTEVSCDPDTLFFSPFDGSIMCDPTTCGHPKSWDFGADYQNMEVKCGYQNNRKLAVCNVECHVNGQPGFSLDTDGNDFKVIICQNTGPIPTLLPASGSLTLQCAETPCGSLAEHFDIANVERKCSESGCTFSCPEGEMPTYSDVKCAWNAEKRTKMYKHEHGSDTNTIMCLPKVESPCGDVSENFHVGENVEINCASFDSLFQTTETSCTASCPSNFVLLGDSALKCSNGQFQNENRGLACKQTVCGDVADHFEITNGISLECENNFCKVSCVRHFEAAIVDTVVCNPETLQFDDILLWENTKSPLINPVISCEVERETLCGNAARFTNVAPGTVINCDNEASTCHVSCSKSMPFHARPNIQSIFCDPNTRKFDIPFDTHLNCNEYAVQCGDLEDEFDLDDDIETNCFYDAVNEADVCKLTCKNPELVVDQHDTITCSHFRNRFNVPSGTRMKCVIPPETPCGYLKDAFTIHPSVNSVCSGNHCRFHCDDPKTFLPLSKVRCIEQTKVYYPSGGIIKCHRVGRLDSEFDTPCGNVELISGTSTISASKSCDGEICAFTCPDGGRLHGITKATCTLLEGGEKSWTYETNFNVAEPFSMISECIATMCGDLSTLDLKIDENVLVNTTALEIAGRPGYGPIMFQCPNGGVISGLRGENAVACRSNGKFEVAYPGAEVKCSPTTCGALSDTRVVSPDSTVSCVNDVCQVTCPTGENGVSILPSISSAVCDTATGQFLTKETKVECLSSCVPFGANGTKFKVGHNVMMFCDDYEAGRGQHCDLLCGRSDGPQMRPVVRETGQKLEKIRCRRYKHEENGRWESIIFDIYGTPHALRIKETGIETHHLVCGNIETQSIIEDKVDCGPVRDSYQFGPDVAIRCTTEICVFSCPPGKKVNRMNSEVICMNRDGAPNWWPPAVDQITCVDNVESTVLATTTTPMVTTPGKKSKKDKKKDKKAKKEKKKKGKKVVAALQVDSTDKLTIEPTNESVSKPANEPVSESVAEPVNEPEQEPLIESATAPDNELIEEPVIEPVIEEVDDVQSEPVNKPTVIELVSEETAVEEFDSTDILILASEEQGDTESEADSNVCDSFPLKITSSVLSTCDGSGCTFSCQDPTLTPNVELVKCDGTKWELPKKLRKVFCLESVIRTCKPVKTAENIEADCTQTDCAFSCTLLGQIPNVLSAKCVDGKWQFPRKTKGVFCLSDSMARFNRLSSVLAEQSVPELPPI